MQLKERNRFESFKSTLFAFAFLHACLSAEKSVAYIYGNVAADGTLASDVVPPNAPAAPYDQMLLTDSGNTGLSMLKAIVEGEGFTIDQYYDANITLDAAFLSQFDVVIFGLHQVVWTQAEQTALNTWIRNGGGILMYSDSAAGGFYNTVGIRNTTGKTAVNSILLNYGMEVTVDQGQGTRAYQPDSGNPNPIIWDQPVLEGEGVSPIAVDPTSSAEVLIPIDPANRVIGGSNLNINDSIQTQNPEWAALALNKVGDGHVMALFDRQPLWNNGPGSDIEKQDNAEILRRIVRYLARDYGNSEEWLNLEIVKSDPSDFWVSYRQWIGGIGDDGFDYIARNNRFAVQQRESLTSGDWLVDTNRVQGVSSTPFGDNESETVTVRMLPNNTPDTWFARAVMIPDVPVVKPGDVVIAINSGGANYTAQNGIDYLADVYFVGGGIDAFPGNAVANTEDDPLYNYARSKNGSFTGYNIPLANGNYTVVLQLAETFFTEDNKRVFDVRAEGNLAINDIDLHAASGGKWVAIERTFPVTVSDGNLDLDLSASVNNPLINAIVVIQR